MELINDDQAIAGIKFPPIYHLETMSLTELASEFNMKRAQLLKLLKQEGFLVNGNMPSCEMLMAGYIVFRELEAERVILPFVTSAGYFFFAEYLQNKVGTQQIHSKAKPNYYKKRKKRVRIMFKPKK